MQLPTREQALNAVVNAVLTAVAVTYAAGRRLGDAYFAHQEVVNEDLATFGRAVVTGTRNAIRGTYRLGQDARVKFNELYPVVKPEVLALYNSAKVRYDQASGYLRNKLNNN